MKQIVTLKNLSCQNCVKHVTEHFLSMDGVTEVAVDLNSQTAAVTTDTVYSAADYQAALAKTIYQVSAVKEG
ncbi:Copper chaperone [Streptococcus sp. DD11]|uniref:heavy-metal-associated domain-containing protein n=1 Tax=Streptococcus sp. DD11 TaxID=1777879 RepID=UPI000796C307|nr:heavy metal-associated domain-containing protein [Streptococcus sp. DD11]KXT83114.1 Copper chaperone [Streptococcus sp. DD11]